MKKADDENEERFRCKEASLGNVYMLVLIIGSIVVCVFTLAMSYNTLGFNVDSRVPSHSYIIKNLKSLTS